MPSPALGLISPLTPDDCAARLRSAIDNDGFRGNLFSSRPVLGKVSASALTLRRRIRYRNSFQTYLTGTMRPTPGGTTISGTFGIHLLVKIFMLVWIGVVAWVGIALLAAAISGKSGGSPLVAMLPLFMVAAAVAIGRFGRFLARDEARFLTDFLIQTLDARPLS